MRGVRYQRLGASGLIVSRVGLRLGPLTASSQQSLGKDLDEALGVGVNLLDVSNRSGHDDPLRLWLDISRNRERTIVLCVLNVDESTALGPRIAEILRNLGLDFLDLLVVEAPSGLSMPKLEDLRAELTSALARGDAIYIGLHQPEPWQIPLAFDRSARLSGLGPISVSLSYGVTVRGDEFERLPAARAMGLGIVAYPPTDSFGQLEVWLDQHCELPLATLRNATALQTSWLLDRGVDSVMLDASRSVDLRHIATALEASLPDGARDSLDATFAGPAGPAPLAYAW